MPFGVPAIEPRWTSGAKEGMGTEYYTSCRVWFTLTHEIINQTFYSHVPQPNTRGSLAGFNRAHAERALEKRGEQKRGTSC